MTMSDTLTAIGIGGNLGDRKGTLEKAVAALRVTAGLKVVGQSSWYETAPVGFHDQPVFLNGALAVTTELPPNDLLEILQHIERLLGRVRNIPDGPRSVDLDLLLYGDLIIDEADLTVPHPRMTERAFVLVPLADILPDAIHPVSQRTVTQLLAELGDTDHLVTPFNGESI